MIEKVHPKGRSFIDLPFPFAAGRVARRQRLRLQRFSGDLIGTMGIDVGTGSNDGNRNIGGFKWQSRSQVR
jgi:hypothetical protein